MSTPRRFGHETSVYERPVQNLVCGRGSMWRKPCWQGPGAQGQCGGTAECIPVRVDDRWECRRPKQAGGRCTDGPLPDGSCAHRHLPCVPQSSLRRRRGRWSLAALVALFVLLVLGPDPTAKSVVNPAAIDPGALTSVHAGFTRDQGCLACHESHGRDALGWLTAAFRNNDPSAKCTECHNFSGPAMRAHNLAAVAKVPAGEVSCVRCHSEHQGASAAIKSVPDTTCANCHAKAFDNFEHKHPAFGARYPYVRPGAINFDHAKHLREYFSDPRHTKKPNRDAKFAALAKDKCTACHAVESATREVRPKPYAEICAGCHESQIAKSELVLMQPERLTPAASVLLGIELEGDDAAIGERLKKLAAGLARSGPEALAALVPGPEAERGKRAAALLAGLGEQTAQAAGTAFAAGRMPEGPAEVSPGAWAAGESAEGNPALFYRPAGHADPVVRAWNEFARGGTLDRDKARAGIAAAASAAFLDPEIGPGICGKCHGAALRSAAPAKAGEAWRYSGALHQPYTRYSHAPHLGLVDPDAGCSVCHELSAQSKYPKYHAADNPLPANYESNFAGIRKETCVECHQQGRVRSACQACHAYHLPHQFNLGFRQKALKEGTRK